MLPKTSARPATSPRRVIVAQPVQARSVEGQKWTLEQPCSYLHSNRNFRERLVDIVGRETF